ncbi:MAG: YfhO family protein [Rhodopirellula sp.]|nr:YfhO family protein [Rhodopirellula sp.]
MDPTTGKTTKLRWAWPLVVVAAPLVAQAIGWGLSERYTYLKWDNFEVLNPWLWEAHGQLLAGRFPHWNQHQMFGEALHAKGQAGALYFPYTLCQAMCRLTGLGPAAFCGVIVFAHLPLASLGYYLFLRRLGTRPFWSALGSIGIVCGGYLTAISSLWIFSFPLVALFPWACIAVLWALDGESLRVGSVAAAGGILAAIAAVGHPQMTVYYWLATALVAIGWACWVHRWPRRLGRLAVAYLLAMLLACPVILPMLELQLMSNRGGVYDPGEFANRGARPLELAGILVPTLAVDSEALPAQYAVLGYQGFWVATSLLGLAAIALSSASQWRPGRIGAEGAAGRPDTEVGMVQKRGQAPRRTVFFQRQKRFGSEPVPVFEPCPEIARTIVLFLVLALVFVLFSLGRHTPVYGWTRLTPIWSSFRWPFKFLGLAMPLTAILAAVSGDYVQRRGTARLAIVAAAASLTITAGLLLWYGSPVAFTAAGMVAMATVAVGAPLTLIEARWSGTVVLALAVLSCGATVALAHDSEAKYFTEEYASVGSEQLGIDPQYRVLPLSEPIGPELRPVAYQQQGLLHAATMNGYDSPTGVYAALYDRRMDDWMPAYVWGCPPPSFVAKLIASHFLRVANVRYCIVAKEDLALLAMLDSQDGYARIKELAHTVVFANRDALPRAYFATRAVPYSPQAAIEGLYENQASLRTAFVEGLSQGRDLAEAAVESVAWEASELRARVSAPEGGLLVISIKSYPGWKAWVDGGETEPVAANGLFQAVWVPAGAREVVLRFQPAMFAVGLRAAFAGVIAMLSWFGIQWRMRHKRQE